MIRLNIHLRYPHQYRQIILANLYFHQIFKLTKFIKLTHMKFKDKFWLKTHIMNLIRSNLKSYLLNLINYVNLKIFYRPIPSWNIKITKYFLKNKIHNKKIWKLVKNKYKMKAKFRIARKNRINSVNYQMMK